MKECFIEQVQAKERKVENMTIKEFHEMSTAEIERYIDRKTQTRFTLDYSEGQNVYDFSKAWSMYKENADKKVISVWALVNHNKKPVLVVEFQ